MTDKEKIDKIKAAIYSRPNHYNGVYDLVQRAMDVELNWRPNTLFGANLLEKQVDTIDFLLKEADERGDTRNNELYKRIARKAIVNTSGLFVSKFIMSLIVVGIFGLILWFVVLT